MEVMDSIFKFFQKKTLIDASEVYLKGVNLRRLQAWGSFPQDGGLHLEFVLPVPAGQKAIEAAKRYVEKLGLQDFQLISMLGLGSEADLEKNMTFFSVHAKAKHAIDFTKIRDYHDSSIEINREYIERQVREKMKRRLNILGVTLGAEGPTLEMDTLLSWQGYMGDLGLESYQCFKVIHLRYLDKLQFLIQQIKKLKIDVLVIHHLQLAKAQGQQELSDIVQKLESQNSHSKLIKIILGPQMNLQKAQKLKFDGGFSSGVLPKEVAHFIINELS